MVTRLADGEFQEGAVATPRQPRPSRVPGVAAFLGAMALVLLYALRGGGSYDLLVFEENGLVVWWLLALGMAFGLLPRTRPSRLLILLMAGLVAYAAWSALSLAWTDSSELTTTEVARVLAYLGVVALVGSTLDRDTWRPAAAGLGFGALLVCALALGVHLAPSVFGRDVVDAALHNYRLASPFGYWNSVGAWAAMATVISLAWSAHDRSRGRAVALGLLPVATLTTYLTYSRTGVISTALGILVVLALSRNRFTVLVHGIVGGAGTAAVIFTVRGAPEIAQGTGTAGAARVFGVLVLAVAAGIVTAVLTDRVGLDRFHPPRRPARALAGIAALAILIVAVAVGPHIVRGAWHSFTRASRTSSGDPTARLATLSGSRYPLWKVTVKAFDAYPLRGTGAGTFEFWWNQHAADGEFVRDAHNIWLQNMAELGLPGLLLIVAVAVTALAIGLRARRAVRRSASVGAAAGLIAAFVVYLVAATVDWMWESTAITVLALAGIAVLGVRLGRERPRMRAPSRIVLAVLALAAGAAQLPGVLSTASLRRSQSAESAGQAATALAWAQAAISAEPWSASAYQQRGLVEESAGQFRAAAADLHKAIAREPRNYVHWLLLSRIETERDRLAAAVHDYARAHQLRPRAVVFVQPQAAPPGATARP